jgi:hypothetical protein
MLCWLPKSLQHFILGGVYSTYRTNLEQAGRRRGLRCAVLDHQRFEYALVPSQVVHHQSQTRLELL